MNDASKKTHDVVIIGSGAGGGTVAWSLRKSGLKILVVEQGSRIPAEPENWNADLVVSGGRYLTRDTWVCDGVPVPVSGYYFVGGATKMYGAALFRLRERDFGAREWSDGVSPEWPMKYEDMESFYCQAERLYKVHGKRGEDPTEPWRTSDYPYASVAHSAYIDECLGRLRRVGLSPFHLPQGIDVRAGGACVICSTCDGFPCRVHAKSDAEVCAIDPAIQDGNVMLVTGTRALRLETNPSGERVVAAVVEQDGQVSRIRAGTFVISCGAVNSAALLLRSRDEKHPTGLANSSGLVGRNLMAKAESMILALDRRRTNTSQHQKTWAVNDFYFSDEHREGVGNIQAVGKWTRQQFTALSRPWREVSLWPELWKYSTELIALTECLPKPENRVHVDSRGRVCVDFSQNNRQAHFRLSMSVKAMILESGFERVEVLPLFDASRAMQLPLPGAHLCGTLRFGNDPETSVLDLWCKTHDVANLYVVDTAFFPSQGSVNSALTCMANALRVGQHLHEILVG